MSSTSVFELISEIRYLMIAIISSRVSTLTSETQFLVDPEAAHVAQVVPLVGEKQFLDHVASGRLIGRFGVAQLAVDVHHGLFF